MKKVIQIIDKLQYGFGRGEAAIEIVRDLKERGWQTKLLVADADPSLLSAAKDIETFIYPFEVQRRPETYKEFGQWIQKHLQGENCLVHCRETSDLFAVQNYKGPVIMSVHSDPLDWTNFIDKKELAKAFQKPDHIICFGQINQEILIEFFGVDKSKISLSASGTPENPNLYNPGWKGNPQLACLARIDKNKNQSNLLLAFAKVLLFYPEARLALFGKGPEENMCKDLAKSLGIQGSVDFLGHDTAAKDKLLGVDLFVLASHTEGLSRAVLEAMMAKVSVCASMASSDILLDGKLGYLHDAKDPDSIASSILQALKDPTRPEKVKEAKKYVQVNFSRAKVIDDLEKRYLGLIT